MIAELLGVLNALRGVSGWLVVLLVVYLFFKYPDSPDKILSFFYKLLAHRLSGAEKKYIAHDIQARANIAASNMNKEAGEILPFKLKVRFVRPDEDLKEALLKKDMAIIKMDTQLKQEENVAKAVHEFIRLTLVREARGYLNQHVSKATTMHVSRAILIKSRFHEAAMWYSRNIIKPILSGDTSIGIAKGTIEVVDSRGYFTRLFLRELLHLAHKNPYIVDPLLLSTLRKETQEFLNFLRNVAERRKGEETLPLAFIGSDIRINIMLVSKPKTAKWGIDPYLKRFHIALEQDNCDRIYIVSSWPNLEFAKRVTRNIQKAFAGKARKTADNLFTGTSRAGQPIAMMIAVFESMLPSRY